ncbi:hypothetical protein CAEBREN_30189, partial [Caenorhabditis brenneri]
ESSCVNSSCRLFDIPICATIKKWNSSTTTSAECSSCSTRSN